MDAVYTVLIDALELTDVFMLLAVDRKLGAHARAILDETRYIRVTAYFSFSPKAEAVRMAFEFLPDESLELFRARLTEDIIHRFPVPPPCQRIESARWPRPRPQRDSKPCIPFSDQSIRLFYAEDMHPSSVLPYEDCYWYEANWSEHTVVDPDDDIIDELGLEEGEFISFTEVQADAAESSCHLIAMMADPEHEHEWEHTDYQCGRSTLYVQCNHCNAREESSWCFAASCQVELADGRRLPVGQLEPGQRVRTPDGPAEVKCVLRTAIHCGVYPLVCLDGGATLSPAHPVRIEGQWHSPRQLSPVQLMRCNELFNFVLSNGHMIYLDGGVEACTLGHGLTEPGVADEYWGSRCLQDLQSYPGWERGYVHLEHSVKGCSCGENGRLQGELTQELWLASNPCQSPLKVNWEFLVQLHSAAMSGTFVESSLRNPDVLLSVSNHIPPAALKIPALLSAFCTQTNTLIKLCCKGRIVDAVSVGAFCLWWVNAIHPFVDGNGRTARGLCHAVLNSIVPTGASLPLVPLRRFHKRL